MKKRENCCIIFILLSLLLIIKNINFSRKKQNFRLLTAFSKNHFNEALRGCKSIGNLSEVKNWENGFMVAYLLENLSYEQLKIYQKACPFVEIRKFPFKKYPKYVKNLAEYRWKPIIVHEVLNETENILYFDTSTIFIPNSGETIKNLFAVQKANFSTCGFRQFLKNAHTIYAATEPSLYQIFNFDMTVAKQKIMYGATNFVITKNEISTAITNKWVKCAKEERCMAPLNSRFKCDRPKLISGEYADCHRYDQSVLAILLVQCSNRPEDYVLETTLFEVKREYIPTQSLREKAGDDKIEYV